MRQAILRSIVLVAISLGFILAQLATPDRKAEASAEPIFATIVRTDQISESITFISETLWLDILTPLLRFSNGSPGEIDISAFTATSPSVSGSVTPAIGVVNSTLFRISGTATLNAIVRCTETAPNGAVSVFNFQANSSGAYASSQFTVPQIGQYNCRLRDMSNGTETTVTYTGVAAATLTGSVSPSSGVINSTLFRISGNATANATVRCTETAPNGAVSVFNFQANASGAYASSQFTVPQVGQYNCRLRDMTSLQERTVTYTGTSPATLTGTVSPASGIVNVTPFTISGNATANATVRCTETAPNGAVSVFNFQANSSGAYASSQFTVSQVGQYNCVLRDMTSLQERTVTYTGTSPATLTGTVSPASGIVNVTPFTISGNATANATVRCTETAPNGAVSVFNFQANASGAYASSQFTVPQVGQYNCRLRDMTSLQERTVTYTGTSPATLTGTVSPASGIVNVTPFTISGMQQRMPPSDAQRRHRTVRSLFSIPGQFIRRVRFIAVHGVTSGAIQLCAARYDEPARTNGDIYGNGTNGRLNWFCLAK
ncbi:MAG: hypothetical protein IPG67_11270 [Acidobacteria bacterium]|nr:hypothetical protein [Acidobacteriota bacterium]